MERRRFLKLLSFAAPAVAIAPLAAKAIKDDVKPHRVQTPFRGGIQDPRYFVSVDTTTAASMNIELDYIDGQLRRIK